MIYEKQFTQYEEVLEKFEDLLGALHNADIHFDLTDVQGQAQVQLRSIYESLCKDILDLEVEWRDSE